VAAFASLTAASIAAESGAVLVMVGRRYRLTPETAITAAAAAIEGTRMRLFCGGDEAALRGSSRDCIGGPDAIDGCGCSPVRSRFETTVDMGTETSILPFTARSDCSATILITFEARRSLPE
jgi:hypothetical protein